MSCYTWRIEGRFMQEKSSSLFEILMHVKSVMNTSHKLLLALLHNAWLMNAFAAFFSLISLAAEFIFKKSVLVYLKVKLVYVLHI